MGTEQKAPKPILTIRVCEKYGTQAEIARMQKSLENMGVADSYFILILPSVKKETKVEVFYEKNMNHTTIEELKTYIKKQVANRYDRGD